MQASLLLCQMTTRWTGCCLIISFRLLHEHHQCTSDVLGDHYHLLSWAVACPHNTSLWYFHPGCFLVLQVLSGGNSKEPLSVHLLHLTSTDDRAVWLCLCLPKTQCNKTKRQSAPWFVMLNSRSVSAHHSARLLIPFQHKLSLLFIMQLMVVGEQPWVHSVNRRGLSTQPWGAPVFSKHCQTECLWSACE